MKNMRELINLMEGGGLAGSYQEPAVTRKARGQPPLTMHDIKRQDAEGRISHSDTLAQNSGRRPPPSPHNTGEVDENAFNNMFDTPKQQGEIEEAGTRGRSFDMEMTITNPDFEVTEDAPEEIEVGVDYSISGKYTAATYEDPADYPELEISAIVDLSTGEDITNRVRPFDKDNIEQHIWDHAESTAKDNFNEPEEPDWGNDNFEESIDLNNGYNDIETIDGNDLFPNGADGPIKRTVGPAGARHGDNPEQKKLEIAETHRELVYSYRSFLKEELIKIDELSNATLNSYANNATADSDKLTLKGYKKAKAGNVSGAMVDLNKADSRNKHISKATQRIERAKESAKK